ncbi:MAG: YqcC family protein [Marinobacterium sp.]|nr:YqcC family protein [Marinobacterium sp.]
MTDCYSVLAALLAELRAELQVQGRWQMLPPSPEALASTQPFCVDTLPFEQWLQWVLIARFEAMVEARLPLPGHCDISPYATEALKGQRGSARLITLITQIDQAISE